MTARHPDLDIVLIESGGDNLSATFSPELADVTLYVIDVAAGEEIPRKGGPAITKSDLLVINKTDLAPHVGADLIGRPKSSGRFWLAGFSGKSCSRRVRRRRPCHSDVPFRRAAIRSRRARRNGCGPGAPSSSPACVPAKGSRRSSTTWQGSAGSGCALPPHRAAKIFWKILACRIFWKILFSADEAAQAMPQRCAFPPGDLSVMARDAERMRAGRPFVFACLRAREGVANVLDHLARIGGIGLCTAAE
jgi:hypothetical protein